MIQEDDCMIIKPPKQPFAYSSISNPSLNSANISSQPKTQFIFPFERAMPPKKYPDRKQIKKKFKDVLEASGIGKAQAQLMLEKYNEEGLSYQLRPDKLEWKKVNIYDLETDRLRTLESLSGPVIDIRQQLKTPVNGTQLEQIRKSILLIQNEKNLADEQPNPPKKKPIEDPRKISDKVPSKKVNSDKQKPIPEPVIPKPLKDPRERPPRGKSETPPPRMTNVENSVSSEKEKEKDTPAKLDPKFEKAEKRKLFDDEIPREKPSKIPAPPEKRPEAPKNQMEKKQLDIEEIEEGEITSNEEKRTQSIRPKQSGYLDDNCIISFNMMRMPSPDRSNRRERMRSKSEAPERSYSRDNELKEKTYFNQNRGYMMDSEGFRRDWEDANFIEEPRSARNSFRSSGFEKRERAEFREFDDKKDFRRYPTNYDSEKKYSTDEKRQSYQRERPNRYEQYQGNQRLSENFRPYNFHKYDHKGQDYRDRGTGKDYDRRGERTFSENKKPYHHYEDLSYQSRDPRPDFRYPSNDFIPLNYKRDSSPTNRDFSPPRRENTIPQREISPPRRGKSQAREPVTDFKDRSFFRNEFLNRNGRERWSPRRIDSSPHIDRFNITPEQFQRNLYGSQWRFESPPTNVIQNQLNKLIENTVESKLQFRPQPPPRVDSARPEQINADPHRFQPPRVEQQRTEPIRYNYNQYSEPTTHVALPSIPSNSSFSVQNQSLSNPPIHPESHHYSRSKGEFKRERPYEHPIAHQHSNPYPLNHHRFGSNRVNYLEKRDNQQQYPVAQKNNDLGYMRESNGVNPHLIINPQVQFDSMSMNATQVIKPNMNHSFNPMNESNGSRLLPPKKSQFRTHQDEEINIKRRFYTSQQDYYEKHPVKYRKQM